MSAVLLVATLTLAVVFAAAGLGKLLDLPGSRAAARGFGVPDRIAGPVGLALPVAETAIALLLLPAGTRLSAATAATLLLLVFCAGMALALARGRTPDCHCFGRLHSEPVTWRTLTRSAGLATLAAAVAVGTWHDPAPGALAWTADLNSMQWVVLGLTVALVVLGVLVAIAFLHLLQAHGRVLDKLDRLERRLGAAGLGLDEPEGVPEIGLAPGTELPSLVVTALDGSAVALSDLLAPETPTLFLFTSPTCGPCSILMPEVAGWQDEHAEVLSVVLLSSGDLEAVRRDVHEHGLEQVFLDVGHAALDAFEANGTPSAVLVGPDATVASWVAQGSDWIERLVQTALQGDPGEESFGEGLSVGDPAPELQLPDLEGNAVSLASLRGEESVLLFWNPDCGFCRSMHGDLLDWERRRNGGSPALVVVSSGSAEESAAEGFASTVLLDDDFAAGGAFRAGGTPMAVRLDAEGRVASGLAAGRESVLELLRPRVVG